MKRLIMVFVLMCIAFISIGCNMSLDAEKEGDTSITEDVYNDEKLVICVSGVSHMFSIDEDGDEIREEFVEYPSKYTFGSRLVGGELDCIQGNIFGQAVKEYSDLSGKEIEIRYLEEYTGEGNLLQTLYETGEELPDVILVGKNSEFDYYRLAEQDMLLDFTAYFHADDDIQSEELYYQSVLKGGRINGKQCIIPVLFNMNALLTSQSYLDFVGVSGTNENLTYEDVLYLLKQSCRGTMDSEMKEAIYEASGNMIGGQYLPSILTAAAYPNYFDEEVSDVLIEETVICSIMELMDLYIQQELVGIYDEESSYIDKLNDSRLKSRYYQGLSADAYEGIGIFLTGGRAGGLNFHNSLLTDVAYFNSVYKEDNEKLVLYGIPSVNDDNSFSANISLLAFGMKNTEQPEEVYKLVRYLMDYEYPAAYGFAVNKEITNKQLEDIQQMITEIYPDEIWSGVYGGFDKLDELENQIERVQPLEEEYVISIQNMLDNIAGAGLPYGYLEHNLYWKALNSFLDGEMSKEDTAEWIVTELENHLKVQMLLEPFYDSICDSVYEKITEE